MTLCPGQDTRYWTPDDVFDVSCGGCGRTLEFFKDDVSRRCKACGTLVRNPRLSMGCAQWCEHARECLGYDPRAEAAAGSSGEEVSLLDRLIAAMKEELGDDQRRIAHALSVTEEAEGLLRSEPGERRVALAAAVLHDIGIQEAERRHGSAAGPFQEQEGPPIARRILESLGVDKATTDEVCDLVGRHHSGGRETPEFRILWDADHLAAIKERTADGLEDAPAGRADVSVFKTESGRQRAARLQATRPLAG